MSLNAPALSGCLHVYSQQREDPSGIFQVTAEKRKQLTGCLRSWGGFQGGVGSGEKVKLLVSLLCLTLCDPMDSSLPGSSVHGILWARILKWVAIPFSRDCPIPGIEPASPAL